MPKKRIRLKVGQVFAILLENGMYSYGRVLKGALMAFYNFTSKEYPPVEDIISKPIKFRVWVDSDPIKTGKWPVLGYVPLDEALLEKVWFYKQDIMTKRLTLYPSDSVGEEIPATLEQCRKLENVMIWRPKY